MNPKNGIESRAQGATNEEALDEESKKWN